MSEPYPGAISRRRLLQAGAVGAAAAWMPTIRLPAASAGDLACSVPPEFPAGIDLYRQAFENWAKALVIDDLWTCAPRSAGDVVEVANWAHRHGWRLRPRGSMHGWSPICITPGTSCDDPVVLADTTAHLTGIQIVSEDGPAVRVGAGATMEELVNRLEAAGLGFVAVPAVGDVTVGGGLAIGMHGASLPARGERRGFGQTYGSLANLVISLTTVVWSRRLKRYVLRTFHRTHPDAKAFLVHLGRSFVTEVTLRVSENQNLRCVSRVDIPASEIFASPGTPGRTFASFVDTAGRVEAIWFPFTAKPWLKTWSVSPEKPPESREVSGPYNYAFSDNLPEELTDLVGQMLSGNAAVTPLFGQMEYEVSANGLAATNAFDLWGKSKNTLLYIRPTTLRVDELGLAVITDRARIQQVLHEVASYYSMRLDQLSAQGKFPTNGPLQLRCSGLDRPAHVGIHGAESPALGATVPRRDRSWDVAIWLNFLNSPGTPGEFDFYAELERFCRSRFRRFALVRAEWSKGWASAASGLWVDRTTIRRTIPRSLSAGRRADEDWDWATRRLQRYDPHGVLSNGFLDRLVRPGRR